MEISQINITISLTDDKGDTKTTTFRPQINLPPRDPTQEVDNKGKIEKDDDKLISDLSDDEFKKFVGYGNQETT